MNLLPAASNGRSEVIPQRHPDQALSSADRSIAWGDRIVAPSTRNLCCKGSPRHSIFKAFYCIDVPRVNLGSVSAEEGALL
jgi:hypothetical protein